MQSVVRPPLRSAPIRAIRGSARLDLFDVLKVRVVGAEQQPLLQYQRRDPQVVCRNGEALASQFEEKLCVLFRRCFVRQQY